MRAYALHSHHACTRTRTCACTAGADGFSFSYGDLPAGPIGELGAGNGLRVCWRTHNLQRLEIWYAGELLEAVAPPGGTLRSDSFVPVEVHISPQMHRRCTAYKKHHVHLHVHCNVHL